MTLLRIALALLLQGHPDPALDPLFRQAKAALDANRPADALGIAQAVLRRAPTDPGFLLFAGEALRRLGRPREAVETLRQADALAGGQPKVKMELGLAATDLGDYRLAAESFRAALERAPDSPGLLFNLGVVLQRRGRVGEALEVLRRARAVQPDLGGLSPVLAEALLARDEFEEAEAVVRSALARSGSDPRLHSLLGSALAGRGDLEGARRAFDDAIAGGERTAAVRLARARVRLRLGDLAGTEEDARAALAEDPYDGAARFVLATSLQRQGRAREAREAFDRYREEAPLLLDLQSNRERVQSNPVDVQGWLNLAYLYVRLDDAPRMAEAMEKAARLHPPLLDQETTRGLAAFAEGRYEEAVARFESVRAEQPDFPDIHVYLQRCHERLGHPEEAKRFRERFEALTAEKRR